MVKNTGQKDAKKPYSFGKKIWTKYFYGQFSVQRFENGYSLKVVRQPKIYIEHKHIKRLKKILDQEEVGDEL